MNVLNDRKPGTMTVWVDDSGSLRHLTVVQDTGNPIRFYYDGILVALEIPDKVKQLTKENAQLRAAAQAIIDSESCGGEMIESDWEPLYWNLYLALKG